MSNQKSDNIGLSVSVSGFPTIEIVGVAKY